MNTFASRDLKQRSAQQVNPGFVKLVVLHSAVSVGLLFLLSLLNLMLSDSISGYQGLDGMGAVSILQTIQSVLSTGANLLLPFWEVGILYAALRTYRRFGPVLRYYLLLIVLYFAVLMVCANLVTPLASLLPLPPTLMQLATELDMSSPDAVEQFAAAFAALPPEELLPYLTGVSLLIFVPYSIISLHLSYRFRFAPYLLVDEHRSKALVAMMHSNYLTKGHKWELFKLDLSFWWYYLLQLMISAIPLLPDLMVMLGVPLPVSADVLYLCCYGVYGVALLVLVYFAGAYVQLTYTAFLEQLRTPAESPDISELPEG